MAYGLIMIVQVISMLFGMTPLNEYVFIVWCVFVFALFNAGAIVTWVAVSALAFQRWCQ
jgi:hypothetical protein